MCVTEKPSQAWMKWVVGKGFIIFVFVLFSGLDGWCVNTNIYIYTHTLGERFPKAVLLEKFAAFMFLPVLKYAVGLARCSSTKGLRQICTATSCNNPSIAMAWGLTIVHSVQNTLHTIVFRQLLKQCYLVIFMQCTHTAHWEH